MSESNIRRSAAILVVVAGLLALYQVSPASPAADSVPYPQDYRKWVHVKSQIIGPQSQFFASGGGIHHIYANDKAIEGMQSGKFADGSVLVFDLLEAQETAGVTVEGPRQRIDVMLKDAQRFAASGGWGFERFAGDSQTDRPLTVEHRALCFSCHEKRKARDYVFSEYRK